MKIRDNDNDYDVNKLYIKRIGGVEASQTRRYLHIPPYDSRALLTSHSLSPRPMILLYICMVITNDDTNIDNIAGNSADNSDDNSTVLPSITF